ncbi:MAG: DUF3427 domain-containing protein [Serratia marcescens]|uniref:DUF3427 domain-containing protein n=2 Tax=Serratia marcescens TaxID=615 RepID=UPI0013DD63E5|nr:DUF3427 domain-containing protein [Serratia marcescens]MDU7467383.1 DUF3427 domain-containing protein [Serratia marcescens]WAZ00981.1 DUF3427 domain-containing protein [Serratia marcescens]
MDNEQQFFWVNHNKERHVIEIRDGILIAGIGGDSKLGYREMLGQVRKGDIVFACFDQKITDVGVVKSKEANIIDWKGSEHLEVKVNFEPLKKVVDIKDHVKHLVAIKRDYLSPINKNGVPQQGAYISKIDFDMASFLMSKANVYFDGNGFVDINKGPSGRVHDVKELMSELSSRDIKEAIRDFSQYEPWRYCYRHSTTYDLVYDGNRYPPKFIFGIAAKTIINRLLISDEFSGGEDSECFGILKSNGFYIEPKSKGNLKPILLNKYDREGICQLFEPGTKFTVGAGRWGISGIIKLKNETDDLVFIVTIEKPHAGNPYKDTLTDDGQLYWETQKQMSADDNFVQRLKAHDHNTSNIHLFLRYQEESNYSYLGLLAYDSVVESSTNPVSFTWRLLSNQSAIKLKNSLKITLVSNFVKNENTVDEFDVNVFKIRVVDFPNGENKTKSVKKSNKSTKVLQQPDWAAADERNRTLGDQGEQLVMNYERERLVNLGRPDLAAKIERVSLRDCSAGYDIKSFDEDGIEILIEVKTTKSNACSPFYISQNEIKVASNNIGNYYLYRVHSLDLKNNSCDIYIKNGSVEEIFDLEPVNYRAKIK